MHILHISPYMAWGGTERCISNLISQSLKNGCRASLLCPDGDGLKRIPPEIPVHTLKNWTDVETCTTPDAGEDLGGIPTENVGPTVVDDDNLFVNYDGKLSQVEHTFFAGHIASIVKNGCDIHWTIWMNS